MVLSMSSQDDLRPRYPMSRRAFVSMVTAGAASTLIQGTAAAAQPLPKARNVVLVLGLFADGSSWSEVIPRLQAAGLNVTSVQNPLTTLPEAVASAERVLARQDGRLLRSLDIARQQGAHSWELRTATSLARLWRERRRIAQARDLLAPVYGRFSEGFATADLRTAKSVMDELA